MTWQGIGAAVAGGLAQCVAPGTAIAVVAGVSVAVTLLCRTSGGTGPGVPQGRAAAG